MSAKTSRAALEGRYSEIAWFQLVGRMFISGGITKKIPAKAAIPPAVLRVIAPSAEREDADHGQVERPADHRARDARMRERDLEDVVRAQDRLAREERDEHRRQHQHERS